MEGEESIRRIITLAGKIGGPSVGAGAGWVAGGFGGAVGGTAIGEVIGSVVESVGLDILERRLSHQQRQRLGAAAGYIYDEITARLMHGELPRADGFFDKEEGQNSSAEELLEGVLLKVVDSYEEKKVRYIAHLFASTAFNVLSPADAQLLLTYATHTTYRGLVCLAVVGKVQEMHVCDRVLEDPLTPDTISVLREVLDLSAHGLVTLLSGGRYYILTASIHVVPADLRLHNLGRLMHAALRLDTIPMADVEATAQHLRCVPSPPVIPDATQSPSPSPQQEGSSDKPDDNGETASSDAPP